MKEYIVEVIDITLKKGHKLGFTIDKVYTGCEPDRIGECITVFNDWGESVNLSELVNAGIAIKIHSGEFQDAFGSKYSTDVTNYINTRNN
jgi:hypothetical protein